MKKTTVKNKKGKKSGKEIKEEKDEEKEKSIIPEEKQKDFIPEIDSETESESKRFIQNENTGDAGDEQGFSDISSLEIPEVNLNQFNSSPSLNKIRASREGSFNLEEFLEDSPLNKPKKSAWQEEFDSLKYNAGINNADGPKYLEYGGSFKTVENTDLNSLHTFTERKPSIQFNPMYTPESTNPDRIFNPAKKTEASELGKDRFKVKPEIKYTPGKY